VTGHHAHGSYHIDFDVMGALLARSADLEAPWFADAASWLRDLLGSPDGVDRVVDAGAGAGGMALALARAFPSAEVVAVDTAPALLELTIDRARHEGVGDRIRPVLADLAAPVPGVEGAAVAWASAAVHHVGDQRTAISNLAGCLGPGGLVALAEGGLPARHLPSDIGTGRPGLEARLDAAQETWFATMRKQLPGAVRQPDDWPRLLMDAGLDHVATRTFLIERRAPLGDQGREHVRHVFASRADHAGDLLDAQDRALLDTLLDDDHPEGLLRRPDVFLLAARTVHVGRRTASAP
jgi:SAM-dependent methyltransferase